MVGGDVALFRLCRDTLYLMCNAPQWTEQVIILWWPPLQSLLAAEQDAPVALLIANLTDCQWCALSLCPCAPGSNQYILYDSFCNLYFWIAVRKNDYMYICELDAVRKEGREEMCISYSIILIITVIPLRRLYYITHNYTSFFTHLCAVDTLCSYLRKLLLMCIRDKS